MRKLEVVFEDFGPQIPTPNEIPFREGDKDLHRRSELQDSGVYKGQYRPAVEWEKLPYQAPIGTPP